MLKIRNITLFIIYGVIFRFVLRVIVGVQPKNQPLWPKKGPFIIVANHNSHVDTMAIMSSLPMHLIGSTHPVAASDYFGKSNWQFYFSKTFINAILIKRKKDNNGPNPIELMSKFIEKKHSLIIFPEGSRGEPQKLQEFKKGVGILLEKYPDVPYIPVYLKGMGKILPKGEKLIVPFNATITWGNPSLAKNTTAEEITKEIEKEVLALKD